MNTYSPAQAAIAVTTSCIYNIPADILSTLTYHRPPYPDPNPNQAFVDNKAKGLPGYKNSHVTLLCALTPRDLRQVSSK